MKCLTGVTMALLILGPFGPSAPARAETAPPPCAESCTVRVDRYAPALAQPATAGMVAVWVWDNASRAMLPTTTWTVRSATARVRPAAGGAALLLVAEVPPAGASAGADFSIAFTVVVPAAPAEWRETIVITWLHVNGQARVPIVAR